MSCMCGKCSNASGWILLVLGVVFLLTDFGVWTFWGISWWSALLVVWGLGKVCSAHCHDCQACCSVDSGSKKKK